MEMHVPIKDGVWWNGLPWFHEKANLQHLRIHWTQGFGGNKTIYQQFGMEGHNGVDFGYKKGTPVVAPCDIDVQAVIDSDDGYGMNLRAFTKPSEGKKLELVFGHLDRIVCKPYTSYKEGELLAYGDSTGFSTGHHLHFGIRPLVQKGEGWYQEYSGNGYFGYVDPEPYLIEQVRWTIGELEELKDIMKFYKEDLNPAIYQLGADGFYYPINSGTTFEKLYGEFDDYEIVERESLEPKGERLGLVI